jgi:hypothetical protein
MGSAQGVQAAAVPRLEDRTLEYQVSNQSDSIISYTPIDGPHWRVVVTDFREGEGELLAIRVDEPQRLSTKKKKRRKGDRSEMNAGDLERSVHRAKRNIRHKIMMLQADRMLTLTYRYVEGREDLAAGWVDFHKFIRSVKKVMPDFQYVAVPEYQPVSGGVHFHLAIKGYRNVNVLRRLWHKAIAIPGQTDFTGGNAPGNVDIHYEFKNKHRVRSKIAGYLYKYLAKDFEGQKMNAKRYSASSDIEKPAKVVAYIPCGDDTFWRLNRYLENLMGRRVEKALEFMNGGVPTIFLDTFTEPWRYKAIAL